MAAYKSSIPNTFNSIEEAGDFWSSHSLADYNDQTKDADIVFNITRRTRYISVPEPIFKKISAKARLKHRTVRDLVYSLGK